MRNKKILTFCDYEDKLNYLREQRRQALRNGGPVAELDDGIRDVSREAYGKAYEFGISYLNSRALEIKKLVVLIPVEIQELPDCDLSINRDSKTLYAKVWIWGHHELTAQSQVKTLKMAGVIGLTSKFNPDSNSWHMSNGELQLPNGYTLKVIAYGTEKPAECEIKETVTTEEVTRYEAICKETQQPVGA